MFCILFIVIIIVVKQQKTIDNILYIQVINYKRLKKKIYIINNFLCFSFSLSVINY